MEATLRQSASGIEAVWTGEFLANYSTAYASPKIQTSTYKWVYQIQLQMQVIRQQWRTGINKLIQSCVNGQQVQ